MSVQFFPSSTGQIPPTKTLRVLGIDLGTTNSTISEQIWEEGALTPNPVRCLEVEQRTMEGPSTHHLVPSIVALYNGDEYVGEGAKRLRSRASDRQLKVNTDLFFDCKNDIGVKRTYHLAKEGFQSATEIGSKVLEALKQAAFLESDTPVARTVITVPASFQAAQRMATLEAARMAGIFLQEGDLVDEPVAAFLDYIFTYGSPEMLNTVQPFNLLVFDFGGGTCDVAIFRMTNSNSVDGIGLSPLSVSRYHRLGGSDIDAAIVYDILIPHLMQQNGIDPLELEYSHKKLQLEPSLIGIAESLKIGLCTQISRLKEFNKYDEADKNEIKQTLPGSYSCRAVGKEYKLSSPSLTAAELDNLLAPFLDRDILSLQETEYRWTCSIYAPLLDALDRCQLRPHEINFCLLTGGSSLIPQVLDSVIQFFTKAKILNYPDHDAVHTSVSRGAAFHAMSLAVTGKGIVNPVCNDTISLRTESDLIELVKQGVSLPYPSDDGYASISGLMVPKHAKSEECKVRVEVVAGLESRIIYRKTWTLPASVRADQPLRLSYRYDTNQALYLRLILPQTEDIYEANIQHPLTHVVNPSSKRNDIYELEEALRTGQVPVNEHKGTMVKIAELYGEIGQFEKGLEFLKRIPQQSGNIDPGIFNSMGTYAMRLRDYVRAEKFYRQAAKATTSNYPLFNLCLAYRQQGRFEEALLIIEEALERERDAVALVMRAMISERVETKSSKDKFLQEALLVFNPISALENFELEYYLIAVRMCDDQVNILEAEEEKKRRSKLPDVYQHSVDGNLPVIDMNRGERKKS